MFWGRSTRDDGIVSIGCNAGSVPSLATLFDPDAPWILLTDFGPLVTWDSKGEWEQVRVPLLPTQILDPVPANVRALRFEVLLPTNEFLSLAPSMGTIGLLARQFTERIPGHVRIVGQHPPAAQLRAFGFVIGVDLPHANEVGQVTAADDATLDAAISRFEIAAPPMQDRA